MDLLEVLSLLEGKADEQKLIDHVGEQTANLFFKNRAKFKSPENDIYYWLKKWPVELEDFLDNYSSNTETRKNQKEEGSKLVLQSEEGDKLYFITTYDAMKQFGSGTRWCIAGKYFGHERMGQKYFDDYIIDNDLNGGYYVLIDGEGDKYCFLVNKKGDVVSVWDEVDDSIDFYIPWKLNDEVRKFFNLPLLQKRPTVAKEHIKSIILLSVEEAIKLPEGIRQFPCWWWLRSPGDDSIRAAFVNSVGDVNTHGTYVNDTSLGVRPALICDNLESLNLKTGDYVSSLGKTWQYVGDDMILLFGEPLTRMAFRKDWEEPDANVYEKSDIKKYLDNWFKEQMNIEHLLQ